MKKSVKKLLCSLLIVVMCLSSVPLSGLVGLDFGATKVSAASELAARGKCGDNVYWSFDSATGALTISGTGEMEDYSSSSSPFGKNNDIKSVVVEKGVTNIGAAAFIGCNNLLSVTLQDSVTSIDKYAFSNCTSLKSIGIPDGVKSIGAMAFTGCASLESITIPYGVMSIESHTFSMCGSLKSITIPDSVTNLGFMAFYMCCSLENLIFSKKLKNIDGSAFGFCISLKSVDIPAGVKTIGEGAFSCCVDLEKITIPVGVETIDNLAFAYCASLESINIPESVTYIGEDSILPYCFSLKEITVDKNNPNYMSENGVLFNKDKTAIVQYPCGSKNETYVVPETVKDISNYAFCGSLFINKIELPEGLESCGSDAFDTCLSLKDVTLPKNITTIGSNTFSNCYYLDKVYVKSMTAEIEGSLISKNEYDTSKISKDDFVNLCYLVATTGFVIFEEYSDGFKIIEADISPEMQEELDKYSLSERAYTTTIYCHSGSTAEAYAIENNAPYILTHFFEGDWTYDYDKMIRYRKCIHCDELEIEPLETTEKGDTEIIAPVDPDTDFNVDEVKPGSDNYIMVEESFNHHGPESFEIIKAFDITMTGKDGVHTQPDGTVKVKIPGDWSKHGVYKVYRVNDDGTLTDMHAYRQGSHLVFDTDHFSLYVVVDESDTADTGSDTPSGGENDSFISRLFAFITRIIEMISSWFKK